MVGILRMTPFKKELLRHCDDDKGGRPVLVYREAIVINFNRGHLDYSFVLNVFWMHRNNLSFQDANMAFSPNAPLRWHWAEVSWVFSPGDLAF